MSKYTRVVENSNGLSVVLYTDPSGNTISKDKGEIRNALIEAGIDPEDAVADLSNALSLLLTLQSRLYAAIPETQKSKLTTADRTLIEYVFSKFAETNTSGDLKFSSEGTGMIDKIFTRWASIGSIVNKIKKFVISTPSAS